MNGQISNSKTTFFLFFGIWKHLSKTRKIQLFALLGVSILSALSEILTLSAVIPFLAILTSSEKNIELPEIPLNLFNFGNISELGLFKITLFFITAVIFASIIRLINLWLNGRLAAAIGSDISCKSYKKSISQPYIVHLNRNSSSLISTLITEVNLTVVAINLFLKLLTALVLSIGILIGLSLINLKLAISAVFIFSTIYLFLGFFSRKELLNNSRIISLSTKKLIKNTQESLGAIREVILESHQNLYTNIFFKSDRPMRLKQANNIFLASFPKYSIEAFGLVFISLFALYLTLLKDDNIFIIPLLGSFALGAQKLLPALQQCYGAWAGMKSYNKPLENVLNLLNQESFKVDNRFSPLTFSKQIILKDINFYYPESNKLALKAINLQIKAGESIGIIGKTGSGKSTLLDLIIGLLRPYSGEVIVDDKNIYNSKNQDLLKSWTSNIAHVPQTIFLSDSSIAENIAFGIPKKSIDLKHLIEVSKKAELYELIKSLSMGFDTLVGEKGVRLSGGQRQRIAIARVLYKKSSVIVFDEATSALDLDTEKKIIKNLFDNDTKITFIMIAHRLSSLKNCDRIIKIDKGRIVENMSSYKFFS